MRVLHVIETLGRGGAERLLVTLLPALAEQGVTPAVAVLRAPYDLQPELEAAGIEVIRLEQPYRSKWRLGKMARAIARAARAHQADLVQAHLYFPGLGLAVMRLGGMHGAATVMTYHNLAYAGANSDGIKLRLRRRLTSFLSRRSMDRSIAVSEAVADHITGALRLPRRPEVIPNPVDPAVARVTPDPLTDRVCRIVLPGRLVREKGHADLLEALAQVDLPKDTQIVFAGGGPLEDTLSRAADHNPHDIRITGWLCHDALLAELAQADLVVIPSRQEGFGITAIEALALARPVIATTAGGLPQAVGQAGRLIPSRDIPALVAAIEEMVHNPTERQALAARGQGQVAQFQASAIAARYGALYQRILTERQGA